MLEPETDVFLHMPDESDQRILHPGKITALEKGVWIAAFEQPDLVVKVDQDMMVYHEIRNKLSKQPARIHAVTHDEKSRPIISFETTGAPVPADGRECYRVSAKAYELSATLGGRPNCPIDDISATGFAVISPLQYQIGQSLPVEIVFEGQTYAGTAVVQAIKKMRTGGTRHGMSWVGDMEDGGNLEEGVLTINMKIQREELRRRAGDAA